MAWKYFTQQGHLADSFHSIEQIVTATKCNNGTGLRYVTKKELCTKNGRPEKSNEH
jgi:hypothetical protein